MRLRGIPAAAAACCLLAAGCGGSGSGRAAPAKLRRAGGGIPASLLAGLRTVGRGVRFRPPVSGRILGACSPTFGRRVAAHVELFAENHVVLIAGGAGTRPPRRLQDARVVRAACFGPVVTLDPTGTVYARAGTPATLGDLFRAWGQPLSATRIASFRAPRGTRVAVYIGGRRQQLAPASVPLRSHSEIVLEVGPHVPPHASFTFPPLPPAAMS